MRVVIFGREKWQKAMIPGQLLERIDFVSGKYFEARKGVSRNAVNDVSINFAISAPEENILTRGWQ